MSTVNNYGGKMEQINKKQGFPCMETPTCEASWEIDTLDRKSYSVRLEKIIALTEDPYVIALTAPWGSGKSFFLEAWRKTLIKDKKPCVYFSAWEFENDADPLFSLIGNIKQAFIPYKKEFNNEDANLIKHSQEKQSTITTLCQKVNYSLDRMINLSNALKIGVAAGLDVGRMIAPNTATTTAKIIDSGITAFEEIKDSQKDFKNDLTEFAKHIIQQHNNHPIVIMIDELDRCKPEYVITLLERIKHLFRIKGLVFILAIDLPQLNNIVKNIYGFEDGTCRDYLDKFFDLYFELPYAKSNTFSIKKLEKTIIHIPPDILAFDLGWEKSLSIYIEILALITQEKSYSLRKIEKSLSIFSVISNEYEPSLWHAYWILHFLLNDATLNYVDKALSEWEILRDRMKYQKDSAKIHKTNFTYKTIPEALYMVMKTYKSGSIICFNHHISFEEEFRKYATSLDRFTDTIFISCPKTIDIYDMCKLRWSRF